MKIKGKIKSYDGVNGCLVDQYGREYIFSNNDLIGKCVMIGDDVVFESELFRSVDVDIYVARFIKKV